MSGPDGDLTVRPALKADLPTLVGMLADDELGATRERLDDPLPEAYGRAFDDIEADPRNALLVVERDGRIAACLQLTFIPSLSFQGGERMQIEGVRVASDLRGHGIGAWVFRWAIDRARERGCRMVQLTTNIARPDTLRFYEKLGFKASHTGMKLYL